MNVLVLGATGGVGHHVVQLALQCGHNVTALVRHAGKLSPVADHLKVVVGDALDPTALQLAVAGQDAVIYALGAKPLGETTFFSDSTRMLLQAMKKSGTQRLICITGVGAGETKGHGGFLYDRMVYPLFTKHLYEDKDRQEELIRQSDRDWVIVRPAPFHEGAQHGALRAVTTVDGITLRRISRAEVAQFVVDQLADDRYLRQTPFIGHEH